MKNKMSSRKSLCDAAGMYVNDFIGGFTDHILNIVKCSPIQA